MKKLILVLLLGLFAITAEAQIPTETDFYMGAVYSVDTAYDGVTIDTSQYFQYFKDLYINKTRIKIISRVYVVEGNYVDGYDTTFFKYKQTYPKTEFPTQHAYFYNTNTRDEILPMAQEDFKNSKPWRRRR